MDKSLLYEGMPAIIVPSGRGRQNCAGKVIKIARRYVTIEYSWSSGRPATMEFDIDTQIARGAQGIGGHTRFRTVPQQELYDRESAVVVNLRAIGLDYSRHVDAGPRPSLEEQEAIVELIRRMRAEAVCAPVAGD